MNKNYTSIIVLITILIFGALSAQETQKNFINYQGVARDASNELMVGESMMVTIGLKFGAATAPAEYEENHSITTDANGVFSLLIGNGIASEGNYNGLPWGSAATFVTVSMNGSEIGTTELMAVPYAISAGNMKNPIANEVSYDNSASGLTATTAQDAIDELVTGGSVDADADPSNEFQMLSFDADSNELSLSDGNSVTIPSGGTDADADPTNEIQTISFDAASNKISLTDGGEITIPSGGTDADADPANELQTLNFDAGTNELSLSDGNSVTIPSGGTDADADPTNEIQTISFDAGTNELSLSDGGVVTIPSGGADSDADPTNEIQDISLAGTELTISDGSTVDLAPIVPPGGTDNQNLTFNGTTNVLEIEDGNTVDLSGLAGGGSSLWTQNTTSIHYDTGRVGIGLTDPSALHHVHGNSTARSNTLYTIDGSGDLASDGLSVGLINDLFSGLTGQIMNKENGPLRLGTNNRTRVNITKDGNMGIGTFSPISKLDVDGNIRSSDLTGTGQRNVMADPNGNLVIGAGGGGSSLWSENGADINYTSGNVGIGNLSPGVESGAGKYLTVATGTSPADNSFASIEIQGGQGGINRPVGRLDFISNSSPGNSAIGRVESRTSGGAQFRGDLAFSTKDGPNYAASSLEERMTIKYDGDVGIGTVNPTAKLDVNGDIKTSGEVHGPTTGTANMIPIAYGFISSIGSIVSGSNNFTVTRSSTGRYFIVISGMTAEESRETTIVATRVNFINPPGFIGGGSGFTGGNPALIVFTHDMAGAAENIGFSFVAYKR